MIELDFCQIIARTLKGFDPTAPLALRPMEEARPGSHMFALPDLVLMVLKDLVVVSMTQGKSSMVG